MLFLGRKKRQIAALLLTMSAPQEESVGETALTEKEQWQPVENKG